MRPLAALLLLSCAGPRGEIGTAGNQEATLWLDRPLRIWREGKLSVVRPPAVRINGRLLIESIDERCQPAIDMWAYPGMVYRIEDRDCKLACTTLQLSPDGTQREGWCGYTSLVKRGEVIEKPPAHRWPVWSVKLTELFDRYGLELTADGEALWVRRARVGSVASEVGLLSGDRLERIGYLTTAGVWVSEPLSSMRLSEIWLVERGPVVLIVRHHDRLRRVDLNRSRRR